MRRIKAVPNTGARTHFNLDNIPSAFSLKAAETALHFHNTIPRYYPTPLVRLPSLSSRLELAGIYVKDESKRFGLNSFKVLGSSYAIARYIYSKIGQPYSDMDFNNLNSDKVRSKTGIITFTTASDGNHGLGVAWTAKYLGHKAVIYLPDGTVPARVRAIEDTGAEVEVTALNYDDTVRQAAQIAAEKGRVLIQDTAWNGYRVVPEWIMCGYMTLIYESMVQMKTMGKERPTHVFLQAGVGSMAASVLAFLVRKFGETYPITVIVEPAGAACYHDSFAAGDGQPHRADGDLHSVMAGLSCGEPNPAAWEIISHYADMAIACDDSIAVSGMQLLAAPAIGDKAIVSGESEAVTSGLLAALMHDGQYADIKSNLGLDKNSIVLLISTEGATDPDNYRKIVK